MVVAKVEQRVLDFELICAKIVAYLCNNPRTRFVEILCYGLAFASHRQSVRD
jgi:hypothetical protein